MTATARAHARDDPERRLEREYEPLKAQTLRSLSAKLHGRGLQLPEEDLEAYYNQAWHALYTQASSGTEIANTGGFLVQVAFRRAIDDLRRGRPDERADVPLEDVGAVEHDVVERLEDERRLREFGEALRDELGERERVAASLCYIHGYTRPEAAKLMGLSERRMQKVMDAVSKAVGRITRDIQAGRRCESRGSVNKAYALGLLDPDGERHATARAHLDECARCRADVLGIRGLASMAPPALLPWAAMHAAGGGAGSARPRRRPRPNQAAAAAAAAAVLVAALAAFALTRGDSEQPAREARSAGAPASSDGSAPSASSKPAPSTSSGATPSTPSSPSPASKPKRDRSPNAAQKRQRRAAPSAPSTPSSPTPTTQGAPNTPSSPSTTAPPAPVSTAPSPPKTTAQGSKPAVLDDGVQEFGLEP
jgi:RNA polymerase sigma factor (sigma-70 family)